MITVQQTDVFAGWVERLRDRRAKTIVTARIGRLTRGLKGDAKPVGGGAWEPRIDFGPGYRAYFVERDGTIIILLCGGDKSSQARDVERAKALAEEVRSWP